MSAPDRLGPDRLRQALGSLMIGRAIVVLDETGSTNDVVADRARTDAPEGLVVFAETQTAGRGQRGNVWHSCPYKGLYFSILLRPGLPVGESARLTDWAAASVGSAIEQNCSVPTRVKPANDIYVGDKKVAGVLVEMRAQPGEAHLAIVGIGINVNQAPADFAAELKDRATSLAMLTGRIVDRHSVTIAVLRELDRTYPEIYAATSGRG
jgi:BirA family transcriptional regulator, biotin operon repressor / biotin---[acetyl-CoA-carboxylase] ligase